MTHSTSGRYITEAVRVRMARLGLRQSDLADASGIGRAQLNRYLKGNREWPIAALDRIAPTLGWGCGLDVFEAATEEKTKAPQVPAAGRESSRKD